jgi:hypothetical protein
LRIVQAKKGANGKVIGHDKPSGAIAAELYLAIANSHTQLNSTIFEPTRWKEGGWAQAFKRIDGAAATACKRSGSQALGRYGRR